MQDLLFNDLYSHTDQTERIEKPRLHLGASQIGKDDERTLWLNYRWSLADDFSPRVLRLFRLGNILEDEIISILRKIPGVTVFNETDDGDQFRFATLGGHFAGSVDGVIVGVPEAPKTPHILECKSASKKQFDALKKLSNYSRWKDTYGAQVQVYMGAFNITRALACVYCKDNSELYFERIPVDKMAFPSLTAKAERIIMATEPPASSWPNEQYYEARFLSEENQAVYWGKAKPSIKHCRNCKYASPFMDSDKGQWFCAPQKRLMNRDEQLTGCEHHEWLSCFG